MLQVMDGWPVWPTTICSCIIGQGKTNINVDALLRVSWLGCMPDTSDTHIQVTAVAVQAIQEAALKDSVSPIKAYSSDWFVLYSVEDSPQVTCMTIDNWH